MISVPQFRRRELENQKRNEEDSRRKMEELYKFTERKLRMFETLRRGTDKRMRELFDARKSEDSEYLCMGRLSISNEMERREEADKLTAEKDALHAEKDERWKREEQVVEEEDARRRNEDLIRQREDEQDARARSDERDKLRKQGFIFTQDGYKLKPLCLSKEEREDTHVVSELLMKLHRHEAPFFARDGVVVNRFSAILYGRGTGSSRYEMWRDVPVPSNEVFLVKGSTKMPVSEIFVVEIIGLKWEKYELEKMAIKEEDPDFNYLQTIRKQRAQEHTSRLDTAKNDPNNLPKIDFRKLCPDASQHISYDYINARIKSLEADEEIYYAIGGKVLYNCVATRLKMDEVHTGINNYTVWECLSCAHGKEFNRHQLVAQHQTGHYPVEELFVVQVPTKKQLKEDRREREVWKADREFKHSKDPAASDEKKALNETYKGKIRGAK